MDTYKKILDINLLLGKLKKNDNNKKIGLCHGVFDLLHIGHIKHFAVGKTFSIRPVIMLRFAHQATDFLKLVHFTGSWKQWLKCIQFCHNATQSENVNRIVVTPGT